MGRILGWISVAMLAAAPLVAQAQAQAYTYRCTSAEGRKYYGSAIPMQCAGRLVEVLNKGGMVVKRIDPASEEKERAARALKDGRRPEQSIAERDEERRNRALLATYTSAKDIEDARVRALADNAQQAGRFETRISELRARRGRYEKELETYKTAGKASTTVEDNIKNVDLEIAAQEGLLKSKRDEVPAINAKYDEDKKRYADATTKAATVAKEAK